MKLKKWLLASAAFTAMIAVCAVGAGAEDYHAYIGFQTTPYSFRNTFDEETYGKDVEGGKYFNSVIVWGGNDPKTFPQYKDNYDHGIDGYVIPATYTDVTIDKDGTYKVGVSDFDWALDGASAFNLLFVSTDIPFDEDAGEDGKSVAEFSNAKIIVDGKVTAEIDDPVIDTEYGVKSGYTKVLFAYIWNKDMDSYAGQYPTKSIEIQFDVSSTQVMNYEYDVLDDGTIEITKYNGRAKKVVVPAAIDGKSVTSIGWGAFSGCSRLTSVTIPNSVTSIGDLAFDSCKSLTSITIPNSVTSIGWRAFSDCSKFTSITIPNSVTSIGNFAFYNCASLESITIPDSVTSIGNLAFDSCSSLKSVTIPDSVTSIGEGTFYNCSSLTSITIPDNVTSIGKEAFENCTSLNKVTISDNVIKIGANAFANTAIINRQSTSAKYIGKWAVGCDNNATTVSLKSGTSGIADESFSNCKSLVEIKIPDSLTLIGEYAFDSCENLKSINIPDSVTNIEQNTFIFCKSLKSITIPKSVRNIGKYAFYGCTSLATINVASGNKNYVSVNGILFSKDKSEIVCYPANKKDTSYRIPGSVKTIGSAAFCNCSYLKSITIPDSVTIIKHNAFYYCTSLTSITIPDGVTAIEGWTFNGCSSLASVTIPDSVTEIGHSAFFLCSSLKSVTIPRSVTKIGSYALGLIGLEDKTDGFTIYCYSGTEAELYAKGEKFDYVLLDKLPKLSKVTGVKLGGRAADALRINWSRNASADGYIVEMYQNGKWVRAAKITNKSTTTFRKSGLKAGTAYKFRVKAYKMSGKTAVYGAYSATVTARTNPSAIKGAKLGGRAADALRINWTKNTSADGYIVEMYKGGKWVRTAKINKNSTTSYRANGLKASTVYKFRVKACKMSGNTALYGTYSSTITARTNPSVVKNVKIAGKAKDALRVSWTKNTSAQGYIVEMYKGGKWVRTAKISNSKTTTFRKAGLAKNTTYKFRVKAYYMSGKTALYGSYGNVSGKTAAK